MIFLCDLSIVLLKSDFVVWRSIKAIDDPFTKELETIDDK